MLRFLVFKNGKPAERIELDGTYLVGTDGVPLRSEIEFRPGEIVCRKRALGPAGLAILWPVKGLGRILLETARLPEREKPYNLHVELLRGRLLRISHKREDWGLYEYEGLKPISDKLDKARDLFIEALKEDDPLAAAELSDQALDLATIGSEELSLFHANVFLQRRKQTGHFPKRLFGCVVDLNNGSEGYRQRLIEGFDAVTLPFLWRQIEPKEQELNWAPLDAWVDWLTKKRIQIKGSALVSFSERNLPDWLYIWENDFETVRDMVYDHARRILERYGSYVQVWDVISGIHADNTFNFNFEQLMELTRMSAALTKQLAPRATAVVDLIAPWGEYYAKNQRSIPPMLYADMAVQSGVNFDAFGLQFYFGVGVDGMYVRDMFQISSMIDRFANLGRALHITGLQVPSSVAADRWDAWGGAVSVEDGGVWRKSWSEEIQSLWLRAFIALALSKPFCESITWRDLSDQQGHFLPNGGLLKADLSPKQAYRELLSIRNDLLGAGHGPAQPTRVPPTA
jgi:hypothetical protein